MHIDQSVYPELDDPPIALHSAEDRADYVHRICTAWDFGIHPDAETFDSFSGWREIFDRFPILTSPGYHAMRAWFGWDTLPYPTGVPAPIPRWLQLDRLEGREHDPCEYMI
jgi:hypothetical protein